jgi:glucokinase
MKEYAIKERVVGVDISLDKTTFAIIDVRGNIIARNDFMTELYPNINDFLSVLCDSIFDLITKTGGYDTVRSVGISVPSGNCVTGSIENSANMPWKGVIPLAVMVRDRLGLAVALANNAHVIALGEHAFGCAHGMRDFVILSLDSGMGSCVFSNGEVYLGNNGFSGEIGHTCYEPDGRQCGCGNKGCLEMYTAGKGIIITAKEVMAESNRPSLMRNVEKLTPKMIISFCDEGDELAIEVMRRTGHALGVGLANYATVFNPEAFIFTGSISHAGKWLMEPAEKVFDENVFPNIRGRVKFVISEFADRELNLLGASVLAWKVKEYSLFK